MRHIRPRDNRSPSWRLENAVSALPVCVMEPGFVWSIRRDKAVGPMIFRLFAKRTG